MFSKSCEYGIRALTVIGKAQREHRRVGIKEICELANTPESFTAKILQNLVRRKVLSSQKGPSGGFYFTRALDEISLFEIVKVIDGDHLFSKCGLGLEQCDAQNPCPLHEQYEIIRNELIKMTRENNLQKLTESTELVNYQR